MNAIQITKIVRLQNALTNLDIAKRLIGDARLEVDNHDLVDAMYELYNGIKKLDDYLTKKMSDAQLSDSKPAVVK